MCPSVLQDFDIISEALHVPRPRRVLSWAYSARPRSSCDSLQVSSPASDDDAAALGDGAAGGPGGLWPPTSLQQVAVASWEF